MSMPSGVSISDECTNAFKDLQYGRRHGKPKFIIFKISDDERTVVLDESSSEPDYEAFRQRLSSAVDATGKPAPRYAVYDVEYDLGEDGKRCKTVFISWVPTGAPVKLCMLYASTKEQLRTALDVKLSVHADSTDEIEWTTVLSVASNGRM